ARRGPASRSIRIVLQIARDIGPGLTCVLRVEKAPYLVVREGDQQAIRILRVDGDRADIRPVGHSVRTGTLCDVDRGRLAYVRILDLKDAALRRRGVVRHVI